MTADRKRPAVMRWSGTEEQQYQARMKACRSRRKQHGERVCPEKDGSCTECEMDMAFILRVR